MLGITLVLCALMIGLFYFLCIRDKYSSLKAIIVKGCVSLCFVIIGIIATAIVVKKNTVEFVVGLMIVLGLVCGAIGDVLLDYKAYYKRKNEKMHDIMTWSGMGVFALGHVFYLLALVLYNKDMHLNILWSVLIGAAVIGLVILFSVKALKMQFGKFIYISLGYGCLLCSFIAYSGFTLHYIKNSGSGLMLLGSILFLLSDLILSTTYFSRPEAYLLEGFKNPESRFMIITNHSIYYIAQIMIAIAILVL